jgi:hypothetical protein
MTPTDHGHHAHGGALHNPDVAHETSDVNVRAILTFTAITTVVTIAAAILVWGVFNLFERQAEARDPKLSPLAAPPTEMPRTTTASPEFGAAPSPRLLTNEPAALRALRQREDEALHQYGWVDQNGGVARIPIDEAKKLIVERGLPSRAGGADAAEGTHAPAFGEANGGRTIPTGEAAPAVAPAGAQPATPGAEPGGAAQPEGKGSPAETTAGSSGR